jgi:putative sigma-54 modulation protein
MCCAAFAARKLQILPRFTMTIPIRISFHGIDKTDTIEEYVRRRAEKLESHGRIVGCHVTLEAPHRHKSHGRHYRVRIDLTVPGEELVVDRCPDEGRTYEDLYASIDLAFDHARKRLREATARWRATHERAER